MSVSSNGRSGAALLITVIALCASLLVSPQADARPRAAQPAVEELRLDCTIDSIGGERGVLCRWSESRRDTLRGYQLYRIVNGAPRELIATVPAGGRTGAFDTDISPGDRIVYGLVARDGVGRVIGRGGPERVRIAG